MSHVVRPRRGSGFEELGWVLLGPKRARRGPVWFRMGPYISRTLIRVSRVIRQGSSGPVGPYRVPTGFRRNPVLARRDPTGLDGSLDCPISVHDSSTDPYTGPSGVPTGLPRARRDPTGPQRIPGGTVGPRFIGASPVWAARSSYWRSQCTCSTGAAELAAAQDVAAREDEANSQKKEKSEEVEASDEAGTVANCIL